METSLPKISNIVHAKLLNAFIMVMHVKVKLSLTKQNINVKLSLIKQNVKVKLSIVNVVQPIPTHNLFGLRATLENRLILKKSL